LIRKNIYELRQKLTYLLFRSLFKGRLDQRRPLRLLGKLDPKFWALLPLNLPIVAAKLIGSRLRGAPLFEEERPDGSLASIIDSGRREGYSVEAGRRAWL
jgi:hypothetical protein